MFYYEVAKNTLCGKLLNDNVLNLSVKVIKDILELDLASNAEYTDKIIIYHLLNACASETSVNQLVISVLMVLRKEPSDSVT